MIEKIKELEAQTIPLDLSNLYNELDTIIDRKQEQMGERIYNIANEFSLLTSKLNPKLYEALQKLNEIKKGLQYLEDLLIGGNQEISENRKKIKINQIKKVIEVLKEKIEGLKSIKRELNQFDINISNGWPYPLACGRQ